MESAVSGEEATSSIQNQEPGGTNKTQKNRKRHHQQPLHLTNEQQDDILTWFQEGDNSQDDGEELPQTKSPTLSAASVEQTSSAASKRKKKTRCKESAALLQRLEERIHTSSKLQERLIDEMSAPTDSRVAERRQWAQWFGSAITDIDDSVWSEFQAESVKLVNTFKARSKYI
ncbi:hypothetical protein DPMN_071178 [Dreissena polymorpha]|uniref:Uncharacterized protein n=1 Tax=Dreissena polymorpha TaxID=45954 RepID=A0A9D3Z782_DREPO|nr:hypothetical protein DPMN_071178 [Dreissena polymorpha]